MPDRIYRALSIYVSLFLLLASKASPAAADQILQIPFEFATGRNALLLHVQINNKPALMILDTGSAQSVLQPAFLGVKPAELTQNRRVSAGTGLTANAIDREVELQVGNMVWKKWPVKVLDQSQAPSAYLDNPDGVLGLDFLQEFSGVALDLEAKTVTLSRPPGQEKRRLSGNLRGLSFAIKKGHYILNEVELEWISADSVEFATQDRSYRVQIRFLDTVLVTKGEPLDVHNKELVHTWSKNIPLVAEILKQQDALGSLKPLIYTLVAPKDRNDLQLREQLTLLWSADPADKTAIGHTGFGPPMQLAGQLSDVQYRDLSTPSDHAISKIMLQILYIQDDRRWMTLGAFVIASKPRGEYEFYRVPHSLLDQIVTSKKRPR
jgi:hypothetical protein